MAPEEKENENENEQVNKYKCDAETFADVAILQRSIEMGFNEINDGTTMRTQDQRQTCITQKYD